MNQKIITRIAKEFNLPRETIAKMVSFYEEIKKDIKEQYLAHLVRTLENRMRRLTKNDFFRIIIRPSSLDSVGTGTSKALYKKGRFFFIGYPKDLDDKKKRVYIAHELGHLYFLSQKKSLTVRKSDERTEPLATIFGMLAILDKDEFYLSIAKKGLLHSDLEDIIKSFKEISN